MQEAGRFWEVEAETEFIRVEADLTGNLGFIVLDQGATGSSQVCFEPEDAEELIKTIREAAALVRKRFPEGRKGLTDKQG